VLRCGNFDCLIYSLMFISTCVLLETAIKTVLFIQIILVGFEVLTTVSTKMTVFRFVAPCSLVEV
jgi:hypothetical protein